MAHQYYSVPPGYVQYDYTTSTSTSPSPENDYYPQSQYRTPVGSPHTRSKSRNHVRSGSYQSPRTAQWTSPVYPIPGHFAVPYHHSSPPPPVARYDYVSTKDSHNTPRSRRNTASGGGDIRTDGSARRRASVRSPDERIYVDVAGEGYDPAQYSSDEPLYHHIAPRSTPKHSSSSKKKPAPKADNYFYYTQTQYTYPEPDTPSRSRARRSSTNTRPKSTPVKPKTPKPAPVATAADAADHHIPAGYSLKNWDPTEEPILLLGSVFDANSLGKWIYDWTVYHHKAGTPLTDVAGELWLLLIKFAGKMKRAEECLSRIRGRDNRENVRDFLEAGERIWYKLKALIKSCEEFMWRAAKKENGSKGKIQMGEKSGIEFVKSIFGRERDLETTEKLMANIRLWNMRFDANCEPLVRNPDQRKV
jgi:hypothetical protein